MLNATQISALGETIGVEPTLPFSAFRRKAISYAGKNKEAPRGSIEYENTQYLNIITSKTGNDKTLAHQPWETVAYTILNGNVAQQRSEANAPPPGADIDIVLKNAQREATFRDLSDQLNIYQTRLEEKKKNFEFRAHKDLDLRKKAVLESLHKHRDGLTVLQNMATDLFERHSEVRTTKTGEGTKIKTVAKVIGAYDRFVKQYAPRIAQSIKELDDNTLVSSLLANAGIRRVALLFVVNNDESKLRETLETLKTDLGNSIRTGIIDSVRYMTNNRLAIEGQRSITTLLGVLDEYKATAGHSIFELDKQIKSASSSVETQRAVWDACLGHINQYNADEKVKTPLNVEIEGLRYRSAKNEAHQLDGIALLKRHAFLNDYTHIPGFTSEQRAVFRDLNMIAQERASEPNTTRATLLCEIKLQPEIISDALTADALDYSRGEYGNLDTSARERIATMKAHPCPYTAFGVANSALVASVNAHLGVVGNYKTKKDIDSYTKQADELKRALAAKLSEMATLETVTPAARAAAPRPS